MVSFPFGWTLVRGVQYCCCLVSRRGGFKGDKYQRLWSTLMDGMVRTLKGRKREDEEEGQENECMEEGVAMYVYL